MHQKIVALSNVGLFIATVFLAICTFILASETHDLQEEIKDGKSNMSINLLLTAVEKLGRGNQCAHFLGDVSDYEKETIKKNKSIKISPKNNDLLNICLAGAMNKENKLFDPSTNNLTSLGSSYIINQISHDMNMLNIIAAAYYSDSSNKEIIQEVISGLPISEGFRVLIDKENESYKGTYLYRYIQEMYGFLPDKDKNQVTFNSQSKDCLIRPFRVFNR